MTAEGLSRRTRLRRHPVGKQSHRPGLGLPGPTGRRAIGFAALAILLALAVLYLPLSWPDTSPPPQAALEPGG
jgi:hypothetical protein